MSKRIVIAGLVALMLSIGGAVYAQSGELIVLSAGTGGFGRYQFAHITSWSKGEIAEAFDDINTDQVLQFGVPVFIRADFFEYISLDATAYYLWDREKGERGYNDIRAAFSLTGQIPNHLNSRLTVFPFLGLGYEMVFLVKPEKNDWVKRKDFTNLLDDLNLKLGGGLNGNITDRISFNVRFTYDILLYNKADADMRKVYKDHNLSHFRLQHGPSLFVGASYAIVKI